MFPRRPLRQFLALATTASMIATQTAIIVMVATTAITIKP